MKIRNDLAKSVVMDFISETFSSFEFSPKNILNMVGAKMIVHNNFDKVVGIVSQDGYIDIDALETIVVPEIEKLGKFEMPAVGTKYIFDSNDVKRLISKLKEKAE